MKYNNIVIAGGNGYLGKVLARYYRDLAEKVIILSRKPQPADGNVETVLWDGKTEGSWTAVLQGADLLVNLCGKNVNCRYTAKNRKEIIASRVIPSLLLGQVIAGLSNPPKLWITVTSATIYRHAEDHAQDEETGDIGYGFSIDVCKQWEEAFLAVPTPLMTRKVALRMGIVLGRNDSVFPRLLNLVKVGLGGRQGDGEQYISWIHEYDVARCMEWLMRNEVDGVLNCVAPEAVKNATFMKLMRDAYGVPFGLPSPQWLLEIGVLMIGTEMELILKSRWVAPKRLLDAGFNFQFSNARHAIHDILSLRV
ncbi:TIGR01777 family oxidoreductase [Pedobacter frigoris]|uniref:TIGR01777 family protein n=1 Tax=Pedobacter frigoris TaxID=2571272 RepID=A0A4U1CLK9_9SPHI|nr:TIGR01777 family oxidoreductase [Pedobacter frigoris]TKC08701.1 TIGR01777 family protein [Pedobacter frigoris]